MTPKSCPCNSQRFYHLCCEPIHHHHASAAHPEQLMRSRYSAYALGLVDFIIQTYHPSTQPERYRDDIAKTTGNHWKKLQIVSSSIDENTQEGFVEFKADYIEEGTSLCLHERSRFIREKIQDEARWYYIDGQYPKSQSIGRNDPCPCGSRKKHKKCCG